MGRLIVAGALAAGLALGAGGGALAAGALGDGDGDARDRVITVDPSGAGAGAGATAEPERLVLEDGIPGADGREAATRAEARVSGRALSVDRDDGGYEVEVQRADGSIAEVRLDSARRVVGVDAAD